MKKSLSIAAILLGAAQAVSAEELTVRTGEHDGYTRLVVQIPADTGWILAQTKNGARLNVALDDVTFETGAVFRRLTQNRLSALSQKKPGDALELQFGCDCVASSFLYKDTMIVVDIAPAASLPPLSEDIPPPLLPKAAVQENPLETVQKTEAVTLPLLNSNARQFENQLSTKLLQGSDRSIVDLNLTPAGPRSTGFQNAPLLPSDLEANINVTSILDELNDLLGPDLIELERQPSCMTNAEIGFDTWSDLRPFSKQVASARAALFHEFDRVDRERALGLARLYAYHGFGVEALAMLDLAMPDESERQRIVTIAQILDERSVDEPNPFQGQQRCDSDAAFWSVLSEGVLAKDAQLTSIEHAFARLPDHLRKQIGPRLSEIMVEGGQLEAARRVLRSVDRVENASSADTSKAKAAIAEAEGDGQETELRLTEAIEAEDAGSEAPLSLARLIEKRWSERGAVSPKELGLAAAFQIEYRESEMHPMLQRAHAVALSLSNDFDQAMDTALKIPKGQDHEGAVNRVVQILVERSDDITFLRHTIGLSGNISKVLTTETAVSVAERLVELGFASRAFALANRPQDKSFRSKRARLRAHASILQGRPHQALLELEGDISQDALALKTRALQDIGDFVQAGQLLGDANDHDEANRLFWLAGQSDAITEELEAKYGTVNDLTQTLTRSPERRPGKPLADAENLLQDSAGTRENISTLLETLKD
jgi:tetratricopeptide (TPR) repeat protein